jgi:phosphoglycerate dehydrogenase-like enzyme
MILPAVVEAPGAACGWQFSTTIIAPMTARAASSDCAGAGLDVFDREPLPPGHRLTKLPNAVLTSHIGWPTDEMYSKFAEAAADVLIDYIDGREIARFVDHP